VRSTYREAMSDRDYDPYARLDPVAAFRVVSDDIEDGATFKAAQFGAGSGGSDVSPHLSWDGAPEGTKSYAVTMYDPDAPTGSGFWHWAVANIPATVTSLPTGAGSEGGSLPGDSLVLPNEMRITTFVGAGPPPETGVHRYFIVIHAVDVVSLDLDPQSTPAVLGFNLHFHTLGRAILVAKASAEDAPS
jgi:Raf kinase inhibitor-like YbhB/YbcL family protein